MARTILRVTDQQRVAEDVPIFAGQHSRDGIYVVVKKQSGELLALDRDYEPLGVLVDHDKTLWKELDQHPAKRSSDFGRHFPEADVTGDAIWLDLDPSTPD